MNPLWLLGLAAAGGLAWSSSAAPAGSSLPPVPMAPPPSTSHAAPSHGQILAAVAVALKTERNPSNLQAFGQALLVLGYSTQGAQLIARAATVTATGQVHAAEKTVGTLASIVKHYTGKASTASADIHHAIDLADAHETHGLALQKFGAALMGIGWTQLSAAMLTKAGAMIAQGHP